VKYFWLDVSSQSSEAYSNDVFSAGQLLREKILCFPYLNVIFIKCNVSVMALIKDILVLNYLMFKMNKATFLKGYEFS